MEKSAIHFLNGAFVEEKDLVIFVRDLGFTRGYAVFDFLVTYQSHRPFMLDKHIDRLFYSAEMIGLATPWSKEQVRAWVLETLAKNEDKTEKGIKMIVSGGVSTSLLPTGNSTIAILVDPREYPPAEYYTQGVGVIGVQHTRYVPEAKTNNYIEAVRQVQVARKAGAIEPVYFDETRVFEGSNSNIFAVIDGKLLTPASHMLAGVTRDVLLEILRLDIPVLAQDFTFEELTSASEVFFTGSNKEVMPITRIDGKAVGIGEVGEVTKEVMRQFQEFTLSDKW